MKGKAIYILIFTVISLASCGTIDLKDNVFLKHPVWEATSQTSRAIETEKRATTLMDAPGLAGLVAQVLNDNEVRSQIDAKRAVQNVPENEKMKVLVSGVNIEIEDPLPAEVATNNITKAFVRSMQASYFSTSKTMMTTDTLSGIKLGKGDFTNLADALNTFVTIRNTSNVTRVRDKNYKAMVSSLSWAELFEKYLTAYYNGNFYDRTGALSTKPKLGLTITNDAIGGLVGVFIESLADFAILARGIKDPIIYEGDETNPTFVMTNSNIPTLWTVLKNKGGTLPIKYVIEKEGSGDAGISKTKLCYIRTVSGEAGSIGQGSSGMIVRAFGGANLGFSAGLGALGKFSFGDNDTLTKVVDVVTEGIGRRSTEMAIASFLYNTPLPAALIDLNLCEK